MVIGYDAIPRQKMEEEIYILSEQPLLRQVKGNAFLSLFRIQHGMRNFPSFSTLGRILGSRVSALDYLISDRYTPPVGPGAFITPACGDHH